MLRSSSGCENENNVDHVVNKLLAKIMGGQSQYNATMEEIHHIHKLDEPSGTAITLAEGIFENHPGKSQWKLDTEDKPEDLMIKAVREGEVPGTHIINYKSEIDQIEIKHEAFNRQGFALGAVLAAEWLADKQGSFGMDDMLKL